MPKKSVYWLIVVIAVLLIAGTTLTFLTIQQQDRAMREQMLIKTRLAEVGISPDLVKALSGSEADLNSSEYRELKQTMVDYRAADPDIRFTYLIGQRPDGRYFFFVDSEPPESADYSPPGQEYTEVTALIIDSYTSGAEMTGGPDSDRWGTWISGTVPLTDPGTGRIVAVFGMDVDARNWNQQMAISAIPVVAGVIILLILILAFYFIHERNLRERKRIEESERVLQQSEEKYRLLFTRSPIGIVHLDKEGTVIMANDKFAGIMGAPVKEFIGFNTLKQVKNPGFLKAINDAMEGKAGVFEGEYTSVVTGKKIVLRMITQPLGISGTSVSGVIGIIEDITERKQAEVEIKTSQRLLQSVLDAVPDLLIMIDRDYRIQFTNSRGHDLISQPDPAKGMTCYGRYILLDGPCKGCSAPEVFETGKTIEREMINPADRSVREVRAFPVTGRDGTVEFVVEYVRDITERKHAEAALEQVTKKLSLLNYVTLNEIENAIFTISGYITLIKSQHDGHLDEYLELVGESIRRIQKSLSFAKDYQQIGANIPQWQDVYQSFIFGISHLDFSHIHRTVKLDNLEIYASPLIERVFLALAKNVINHAKGATEVTLGYEIVKDGLLLNFRDNGPGIPDTRKEKIFERGYGSLKGMELFLVREILSITGITIRETGTYGEGACFEFFVPNGAYRFRDKT